MSIPPTSMPTKNTNKKYYNLGRVKNCVCLCYQILIKHECRVPAKSIIIGHRLSMVHCHSIRWRSVRHSISALNWIVVAANLLSTCPTPGNINGGNRRGGRSLPFFEFLTPFPVTSRIRNGTQRHHVYFVSYSSPLNNIQSTAMAVKWGKQTKCYLN